MTRGAAPAGAAIISAHAASPKPRARVAAFLIALVVDPGRKLPSPFATCGDALHVPSLGRHRRGLPFIVIPAKRAARRAGTAKDAGACRGPAPDSIRGTGVAF